MKILITLLIISWFSLIITEVKRRRLLKKIKQLKRDLELSELQSTIAMRHRDWD
jgi:hypothetical protein